MKRQRWISLRSYADDRRRRGLHLPHRRDIQRAIADGKVRRAVVFVKGAPRITSIRIADRELSQYTGREHRYAHLSKVDKARAALNRSRSQPALARCHSCGIAIVERDRASHMTRCPGVPVVARKRPCP